MKRLALLVGTLALAAALQSRAHAQVFTSGMRVEVDGAQIPNGTIAYVTRRHCPPDDPETEENETDASLDFEFELSNYGNTGPNPIPIIEVWASSTADCSTAQSRTSNATTTPGCWLIAEESQISGRIELKIPANQLFRNGVSDENGCPDQSGTKYTVYFVPLAASTTSNPSNPPAPLADALLHKATFTLATDLPNEPTSVSNLAGETRVGIKWKTPAGAVPTTQYRAYFDTSVGADSTCAESRLVAGATTRPATDGRTLFASSTQKGLEATLSDLDAKGVPIGNYVAASAVTIDIAGNESALSEVRCVQRVETASFLDNCEADPGCEDAFDSCSVSASTRNGGLVGLGMLFAVGVALGARRRRHV